ncbi:MAG: prolyl oligopeptidase family serine peptidase [Planctomycetia bacterium]|nr:prolyl oligopeptidase family serine peptidase [Planctomycetia bacterium]
MYQLFKTVFIGVIFSTGLLAAPLDAIDVKPDVVYGHKDGMALSYDVFKPRKNSNGVGLLFMISGGWVSQWTPPEVAVGFFKPFLNAGYTVITVRHGSSPRYVIPEIAQDVRLALNHGDAKTPRVAAVAAVFPPTDLRPYVELTNPLRERFPALKFDASKVDLYSPLLQVTQDDAPTLLVHGDKDELVPLWHSEKICDAFTEAHVDHELLVIKGAAHGFDADGNKRMFEAMIRWFDTHLATMKSVPAL